VWHFVVSILLAYSTSLTSISKFMNIVKFEQEMSPIR
jgi:hypothetical protein